MATLPTHASKTDDLGDVVQAMPELPEVEAVCRLFRRELGGKRIVRVITRPDDIVMGTTPPEAFHAAIEGRTLQSVGRKGKYWWLDFGEAPVVFGHLGMSGWVRPMENSLEPWTRLHSHGKAKLFEEDGTPRFMKILLEAEDGARLAMTDGRRLARLWIGESPALDPRVAALGRDAYDDLPESEKSVLEGLTVLHSVEAAYRKIVADPTEEMIASWKSRGSKAHPLIWTHRTGRKSIVHGITASHVVGMGRAESDALLKRVLDWATQP
ncbi:hypothetical protein EON79_17735, partial [bacterium]